MSRNIMGNVVEQYLNETQCLPSPWKFMLWGLCYADILGKKSYQGHNAREKAKLLQLVSCELWKNQVVREFARPSFPPFFSNAEKDKCQLSKWNGPTRNLMLDREEASLRSTRINDFETWLLSLARKEKGLRKVEKSKMRHLTIYRLNFKASLSVSFR